MISFIVHLLLHVSNLGPLSLVHVLVFKHSALSVPDEFYSRNTHMRTNFDIYVFINVLLINRLIKAKCY